MTSWLLLLTLALAKPRADKPTEATEATDAPVAPVDDNPAAPAPDGEVDPTTAPPEPPEVQDQNKPSQSLEPSEPATDPPAALAAPPPRPPPPVVFPAVPRAEPPPDVSPVAPAPELPEPATPESAPAAEPPPDGDPAAPPAADEATDEPAGRARPGVADPRAGAVGWLPRLPQLPPLTAGAWLALAALLWSISRKIRAAAATLPEDAPAAQLARLTGRVSRVLTLGLLLLLGAATLPAGLAPLLGWAVLGAALALGWSAQEVLRDVVAGLGLGGERGLTPGAWAEGPGFSGAVIRRGLRATTLRAADGSRVVVPHRALAAATLASLPPGGPPCRVVVDLPPNTSPGKVRRAVHRAVAGSPWVVQADPPPSASPLTDGRWEITVPVLGQRWTADVLATLPERLRAELAAEP
jgi:hypothetical protein